MHGIDAWLADIGLEKYVAVFRDAEIDLATLPELVEEDLKELNLPLGPRRKIWGAITRMQVQQARQPNVPSTHPHFHQSASGESKNAPAERRHLTVMFVDLVGSTAISSRLDAEDMRKLIAKFQSEIAIVVGDFEGFVAQFLGDGVLCYFGWPHASEDDTERAVRAGLLIIETVNKITEPDGTPLAVRIGIATGVVIVGDLMMNGGAQEAAAVGETTNLAARLQGIAEANSLVISGDAQPLLGSAFELTSLGWQELKGIGQSVEALVVTGVTAVESRFAARRPAALAPIVGRDREIGVVLRCWSLARSGRGQMLVLRGEAGIGKSRLIQAITDVVASEEHSRITYQCSPHHTESAFYPLIHQMSLTAGFVADDSNSQRLSKMETMLAGDKSVYALMALLLGLDGSSRYGDIDATPVQQRSQLMQMLLDQLIEASAKKPLLLIFEDLHWIDPTSLELLELLLERLPDQKIMLLATTRPSFDHLFAADQSVTELTLNRLGLEMTSAIAEKMAGGRTLPEEVMNVIARRTDGVPLFVEELTKLILESGALKQDGAGLFALGSFSDVAIPATLHDSLMARLDRLGPTKEIAQIAACIGRDFSYRLLVKVCELPQNALDNALSVLTDAEMINRSGSQLQSNYSFKHALVRDAAYDGLLKERRGLYHTRIVEALEAEAEVAPELLAAHAEAAGLAEKALELWEAAGNAAISRPAYKEAEAHYRRAIALNKPLAASGDKDAMSKAVALHVQLFVALSPGIGLWADETLTTLEEALKLADAVKDSPQRGDIIYGLILSTYFRGSLESSRARADEFTSHAAASGDTAQLLVAKRLTGNVQLSLGQFSEAEASFDTAAKLCEEVADQNLAARFGHDPTVAVKIYQSLVATFQGKTARAEKFRSEAETRAGMLSHTNTSCAMLGFALTCAHVADDIDAERHYLKCLQLMIEEHAVTASHLWAEVAAVTLRLADGDVTGVDAFWRVEAKVLDANIRLLVPGNRILAARRILALGLQEEAQEIATGVEAMMIETGEKSWLAELHRLRSAFALKEGDDDQAEKHLQKAIKIAVDGQATLWEARAKIDLATLYNKRGLTRNAMSMISPLFDRIGRRDCPREMRAAIKLMIELDGMNGDFSRKLSRWK